VTMPPQRRVLIVQEYVPDYRLAFFERLRDDLNMTAVQLVVAAGVPSGEQAKRGDDSGAVDGIVRVPARGIRARSRSASLRTIGPLLGGVDLVIVEQAIRQLETYRLLLGPRPNGLRVALWGHGRNYVSQPSVIEEGVKGFLTRRANWFFAYTRGGAEAVASAGFPPERITVVQNSTDTKRLQELLRSVTKSQIDEIQTRLGLPPANVCLFVGALDATKRLDFLFTACRMIADRLPDFTLIVAGDGPLRPMVERLATQEPWLRYVGRASDADKAVLARISQAIVMPGGVGLVAVDAFALETPIVTTDSPAHGPEFEYLEDGRNAIIAGNTEYAYANAMATALTDTKLRSRLEGRCRIEAERYSVETMATNFRAGILDALGG